MIKKIIFIISCIFPICFCHAKIEFGYKGKPIHPSCVEKASGLATNAKNPPVVSLAKCTKQAKVKPEYENDWLAVSFLSKGGEDYYHYSARYKVFLQDKNKYLIGTNYWGGGTGQFSFLFLLKREGDKIRVIKALGGGDRCNGGLSYEQGVKNNTLYFSKNITPADFIDYAPKLNIKLKRYVDLQSCPVCCYGRANYLYRIGDKEPKLLSIELYSNKPIDNPKDLVERSRYQYYFNEVYNKYIKNGKTKLVGKEIYEFMREFKEKCSFKKP